MAGRSASTASRMSMAASLQSHRDADRILYLFVQVFERRVHLFEGEGVGNGLFEVQPPGCGEIHQLLDVPLRESVGAEEGDLLAHELGRGDRLDRVRPQTHDYDSTPTP